VEHSENRFEFTAKQLAGLAGDLRYEVEQAWTCSLYYIAHYLEAHVNNGAGMDTKRSALMAAGRLEWLLQETRPTLSGLFNESDIFTLMHYYKGNMFYPEQLHCILPDLCDFLGIKFEEYGKTTAAPLIDKLRGLDQLQLMTLADALENVWFQVQDIKEKQLRSVLQSFGIHLT
jgi:hypothetical protein